MNARGEIVDLTPEDSYATIDICDIDFSFLDDKNIVCGLCGEVVAYSTLFSGHLSRVHPEVRYSWSFLLSLQRSFQLCFTDRCVSDAGSGYDDRPAALCRVPETKA